MVPLTIQLEVLECGSLERNLIQSEKSKYKLGLENIILNLPSYEKSKIF